MLTTRHQVEILRAIVVPLLVLVMYVLAPFQPPTQHLTHDQPVFGDVVTDRIGVIRGVYPDVALLVNSSTALPIDGLFAGSLIVGGTHLRASLLGVPSTFHGVMSKSNCPHFGLCFLGVAMPFSLSHVGVG